MASEASEISENQHKKVMSPEHIIEALQTLGFNDYIEDVKEVFKEYKEQASVSCFCILIELMKRLTLWYSGFQLSLCFETGIPIIWDKILCLAFTHFFAIVFHCIISLLLLSPSSQFVLSHTQKHRRKGKSRLERLGVPEEELHRQQQELFEQARQQQLEVSSFRP